MVHSATADDEHACNTLLLMPSSPTCRPMPLLCSLVFDLPPPCCAVAAIAFYTCYLYLPHCVPLFAHLLPVYYSSVALSWCFIRDAPRGRPPLPTTYGLPYTTTGHATRALPFCRALLCRYMPCMAGRPVLLSCR